MATFTYLKPFGTYVPNTMAAGFATPYIHTDTEMTYTSVQNYTVQITGTGFAYDDNFYAYDGTVNRIVVSLGGVTYADFTGLDTGLQRLWNLSIAQNLGGYFSPPDMAQFMAILLSGDDSIVGSNKTDVLMGGIGNDTINAGAGRDVVFADAGNDVLNGGDDRDTLSFENSYTDFTAYRGINLNATTGKVTDCWGGRDTFTGFEVFMDSVFNDILVGSTADERFSLTRGNDRADGGSGFDILTYENAQAYGALHGVSVNLNSGLVRDAWGGTDRVSNMDQVRGTVFADTLIGSAADESFVSGDGIDVVNGGLGFDTLAFWLADDIGHGAKIDLTKAVNVLDDGFGNAETAVGIESFVGTIYDDWFIGNGKDNALSGSDGGNDTLSGGGGSDSLLGDTGDDLLTGGNGADYFLFWRPVEDSGVDHITDMAPGTDRISVIAGWGGGLAAGGLVAGQFLSGAGVTQATTADQRFIYNSTTGDLYFDQDGSGAGAAIKFAVLDNLASISFADFQIVA